MLIDFSKVDNELESIEAEATVVRVEQLENGDYGNSIFFETIPLIDHRRSIDLFVFKNLVYQQNHLFRFTAGSNTGSGKNFLEALSHIECYKSGRATHRSCLSPLAGYH